jgi:hypothetical protein
MLFCAGALSPFRREIPVWAIPRASSLEQDDCLGVVECGASFHFRFQNFKNFIT